MNRTIAYYENRINTLQGRGRENQNIIKKLQRKIRNLEKNVV